DQEQLDGVQDRGRRDGEPVVVQGEDQDRVAEPEGAEDAEDGRDRALAQAAHQIVAISRPRAVADRMIASGAPRTPAGTTPTRARPSATEPTMKLPRPKMAGSPAI